ncbi:MAG: glutathione peroxidase [Bdellovibrionota bacterium]
MGAQSIYSFEVNDIHHKPVSLEDYRGKLLLVVNVASRCGLTGQYKGLEELYKKYRDQGLVVLGFPCNQFKAQEPGSEEEILKFCQTSFDVSFPMFEKIDVNGDQAHPLYKFLRSKKRGLFSDAVKWNFTKFLVNRDGTVLKRYAPTTDPGKIEADIVRYLAAR